MCACAFACACACASACRAVCEIKGTREGHIAAGLAIVDKTHKTTPEALTASELAIPQRRQIASSDLTV